MWFSLFMSLVVAAVLVTVAVFSTTIHLHRSATHMALVLHPFVTWVFKFALWLTTGQVTREWVAVHRKHHSFTDQEGDPHSPKLKGFWSVQLWNVVHYVKEVKELTKTGQLKHYSQGITECWWDRAVFNRGPLGLAVGITALCLVVGQWIGVGWALLAAGIHAVVYVFLLTPSINGLCHTKGYRNFDNTATNLRSIALLTGGEGLHNNHHGYPRSPKFSFRKSEIDPAWPLIRLLISLKLAKPYKTIEEVMAS